MGSNFYSFENSFSFITPSYEAIPAACDSDESRFSHRQSRCTQVAQKRICVNDGRFRGRKKQSHNQKFFTREMQSFACEAAVSSDGNS